MERLHELTATDAAARIADGEITSEALVRACLERIEAREPDVAAWAYLDPDQAIRQARARDAASPAGPLHGVPVAFKDIIDTADMPTACGSPIHRDRRPLLDAACVAMARAAGAVVLGKTVTTEFAGRYPGRTSNPHDRTRTPGGSSSGSAAAVADAMVPLAVGTQTLGSVIRPAAYCGVHAYKPTFGLLSFVGVKHFAESFDTLGLMARSLADLDLFRTALLGHGTERVNAGHDAPPHLAFCRTPYWHAADAATRDWVERAAARLAETGATVEELELPEAFAAVEAQTWRIVAFEAARNLAPERAASEFGISAAMHRLLDEGAALALADYIEAVRAIEQRRQEIDVLLQGYDAVLAPSAPGEAPRGLADTGAPTFNVLWHAMGMPALNLPAFDGSDGLPLGIQLVARRHEEQALLRGGHWVLERLGA